MDAIKCDISTVAFGMCASTATLLLVSAVTTISALRGPVSARHSSVLYTMHTVEVFSCALSLIHS